MLLSIYKFTMLARKIVFIWNRDILAIMRKNLHEKTQIITINVVMMLGAGTKLSVLPNVDGIRIYVRLI